MGTEEIDAALSPTDYDAFKAMLTKRGMKFEETNHGPVADRSIVFDVLAGCCGSETTLGEAFFDRKTGDFNGIHHCD